MTTTLHLRLFLLHDGQWYPVATPVHCTELRAFPVSGALADIANTHGVPVLSAPRGLPEDLTAAGETDPAAEVERLHGTSWLTLAELQAYDWLSSEWQQTLPFLHGHVTLEALARPFRETVLPALASLGSPEHVRMVFTFEG